MEFQMKNSNLTHGFRGMNQIILALFLFTSPFVGVYAACCAGHGGVASCNKSTGQQICKDGSASPTCKCAVSKATKKNVVTPHTTTKSTTTTTTKPKSSWWGGKSTNTPPATTKSTTTTTTKSKGSWWDGKSTTGTTKGCCSRHGGVAQCNKASGHQMCKDGTQSPSCTCH